MARLSCLFLLIWTLFGAVAAQASSPYAELRPAFCGAITARELPADAVSRLDFTCPPSDDRYHDRWLWMKAPASAQVQALADKDWLLLVDQPRFQAITATVRYDDGSIWQDRIGADSVGDHWAIGGYIKFAVPGRTAKPVSITLGFDRLAAWELIRKVRAVSATDFVGIERSWLILMGVIAGAVASGLFYSLFLVAGLRYNYLSHYALWTLSALLHCLFWTNIIFLVAPQFAGPWGVRINLWTAGATMFFSLTFFVTFFEPGRLPKWFNRFLLTLAGAIMLTAIFGSFEQLVPAAPATQLFDALMLAAVISVVGGTIFAVARGSRAGLFYLAAWTPPIVALVLRILRNFGVIPHSEIVDQGVFVAAALQTLLLAVALADRFVRFRRERDSAAVEREQLRTLSETDQLTGLYNRRGFITRIQAMLAPDDEGVGLILLDLDSFKAINDDHGHDIGDIVLMRIGRTILKSLKSTDTAGRMGGEEFAIAIRGAERATLKIIAERIRREIAACRIDDLIGEGGQVTVSIGIVTSRTVSGGFVKLYRAADEALYASKHGGKNRVTAYLPDISSVAWDKAAAS